MMFRNRLPKWMLAAKAATLFVAAEADAATSRRASEATRGEVAACRSLGEVRGDSGFGKHAGFGWVRVAEADARRKAGALGATHVVWEDRDARGAFNGRVLASAWACN